MYRTKLLFKHISQSFVIFILIGVSDVLVVVVVVVVVCDREYTTQVAHVAFAFRVNIYYHRVVVHLTHAWRTYNTCGAGHEFPINTLVLRRRGDRIQSTLTRGECTQLASNVCAVSIKYQCRTPTAFIWLRQNIWIEDK